MHTDADRCRQMQTFAELSKSKADTTFAIKDPTTSPTAIIAFTKDGKICLAFASSCRAHAE